MMLLALYAATASGALLLVRALGWTIPGRIFGILALIPLAFFIPAFLGLRTPLPVDHCFGLAPWSHLPHGAARNANMNDVARQGLPWAKAVRDSWLHGTFPWLDRWNGCGTPLSANGQSAAYAPWTLLALLLPLAEAFVFIAALKLLIALLGTWFWLRCLGLSEDAALFGAILNGLGFSMTLWLFWQQSAVISLWPWCLFLIECLILQAPSTAWWALICVFALIPLAGHVESAASGATFIALWLLTRLILGERRIVPAMGRVAVAAALGGCLSMFSLIPQVLAILASNRLALSSPPFWAPQLSWVPHGPRWPALFLTTLFPRSLGDQIASPLLHGAPASFPELGLGYIGCVGWCFVAFFLLAGWKKTDHVTALLIPVLVSMGTASLSWPFAELMQYLPGLRYVFPIRFLSWVCIGSAAIAGFGLERFGLRYAQDRRGAARRVLIPTAALAAGSLLVFGTLLRQHAAAGGASSQLHSLMLIGTVLLALALWLLFSAWFEVARAGVVVGVSILAAAELFFQGERYYTYGNPKLLYPATPLIRFLDQQQRPFRVLGEGRALYPNSNVFANVEEIRVHDPAERRDYVEFLDQTCRYDPRPYFKDIGDINAPALDFLNVKYLVSGPRRATPGKNWFEVYSGSDGSVFENREVLPRAFAPRTLIWVAGPAAPRAWHRNAMREYGSYISEVTGTTNWMEYAYLLGKRPAVEKNPEVEVSEYREDTNRIAFRAVTHDRKGAVVVLSIVQNGGWTARDGGGKRLETFLANGPFLAVEIPGGSHRCVLSYVEPGFALGASCSALTAILLLVLGPRITRRVLPP